MDARRRQLTQLGLALATTATTSCGFAQPSQSAAAYPSHTVRLIIPFAVGGGTDIIAREMAHKLTEAWKETVVVDNKAGGNGIIGLDAAAKSAPDGYTLTMITASSSVNVTLQGHKQPYDLIRDFAPITQITTQPYVLVINPQLKIKNLQELLAMAREREQAGNPMTYGSSGVGGLSHLSGALLSSMTGIKMTHVPYRGGSPALNDVVSGQIDMLFSTRLQSKTLVGAGKLRALAVTSAKRVAATPDLPTMQEAGVPGYEVAGWYGIMAPANTPKPIIEKVNLAILEILKMPDIVQKMDTDGSDPVGTTPEQFDAHIRSEVERWRQLIVKLEIPTE